MMSEDHELVADRPDQPALPVKGCVDGGLRLIAADPVLERLQSEAGARLGARLAIAPLADVVRLARELSMPVTREARVADANHRYDILVTAAPEGEVVRLTHSAGAPEALKMVRGQDFTASDVAFDAAFSSD
ncbi:MAG: hypothetical protein EX258_08045 [Sphingomonadaceae bacterium]|nr:MAG: hypothetical protein EX258_08045 [Sphingomonadaceae bacterium]